MRTHVLEQSMRDPQLLENITAKELFLLVEYKGLFQPAQSSQAHSFAWCLSKQGGSLSGFKNKACPRSKKTHVVDGKLINA